MKNLKITMLALLTIAFVMAFTSCQDKSNVVSPADQQTYSVPELSIPTTSYVESDFQDATTDVQLAVAPPEMRMMKMMPFGMVLRQLKLTADQQTQVKGFMKSYDTCVKNATAALRAAEKAVLDSAKPQIKDVLAAFKAGTINRKTALDSIMKINRAVRLALKNLPERATADTAVKDCLKSLLDNISGILTADQLVIWNKWLDRIKNGGGMMGGPGMMGGHK